VTPSVVVLGLPKAGKSSFIAALSHILQFHEVPTVLELDRLADEDKYLFEMRALWQNCEPFDRTGGGPVHPITLHLRNDSDFKGDVYFPDVIGEEFEEQWRGREWSVDFTAAVSSASGLLLFINPLTLEKPLSIVDIANAEAAILEALGDDGESEHSAKAPVVKRTPSANLAENNTENTGEAIAREVATQSGEVAVAVHNPQIWNPRDADSQVKIVDLLQAVASFKDEKKWTLGVVISAWDVVTAHLKDISPSAWFEQKCPLISQYLSSNPLAFRHKVFGVSAQGGDPTQDSERLRSYDSQSERVRVVFDGYDGHDLTRVLLWAMEQ
jgi:hypothetical protein